jgi:hypothetical protein
MQNLPLACAARLFPYIHYRTSLSYVAGRLSALIERKIIVTKLNTVLLASLVSAGLLTIGADSAFAGGYFSAGSPGGLPAESSYRVAAATGGELAKSARGLDRALGETGSSS